VHRLHSYLHLANLACISAGTAATGAAAAGTAATGAAAGTPATGAAGAGAAGAGAAGAGAGGAKGGLAKLLSGLGAGKRENAPAKRYINSRVAGARSGYWLDSQ